jgi:hypothetical protein
MMMGMMMMRYQHIDTVENVGNVDSAAFSRSA